MRKLISALLLMLLMTGAMLSSCSKDEDIEESFSLNGTSWQVIEESDSTMMGVVLTFMDNGEVKLSKALDGWNTPKWTTSTFRNVNGFETCSLTITMDGGEYLSGDFIINGEYVTQGSTSYNAKNRAQYSYSWYEKGQDIYSTLSVLHIINLRKQ